VAAQTLVAFKENLEAARFFGKRLWPILAFRRTPIYPVGDVRTEFFEAGNNVYEPVIEETGRAQADNLCTRDNVRL
jgi:hypothetical protein